ncbi:MAG: nitrogenase component 1 [Elusimicrobiota bacterium]
MADNGYRSYENPNCLPPDVPGWRSFLKRDRFARHKYHSLMPAHPCVDIMHGDLECRYTHPTGDGRTVSFLNFPWLRPNRESTPAPYRVLTTDMRESDVVAGALGKARRQLRLAVEEMPKGAFVLLNSACVPDVTGEDLETVARPWRDKAPVFYEKSDGKDKAPPLVSKMIALAGRPAAGRRKKGVVNLMGCPPGRVENELRELLAAAGLRVAASLVPLLSPARIRAASSASLNILMPNRLYDALFYELLRAVRLPIVRPPPPYGLDGTTRWLAATGGKAAAVRSRRRWEGDWGRLRREAARHRLGFIVDPGELAVLSDPALNAGCPLLPMSKEMGFGVDLLVYDPAGKTAGGKGRHRAHSFGTPDELAALISGLSCGAFYSDCFFDARLSRRGKGQFSLNFFEAGFAGGVRTLERLLDVCRLPFYRRYGRYLGPHYEKQAG